MKEPGIFKHSREALVFSLNYSIQQYALSPMAKMVKGSGVGSGRGLVGLDGAAQAGMVLAELQKLTPIERAVLVARCAPRVLRCECRSPCCAGYRANPDWREAISELTEHVIVALSGTLSHYRVRSGCVQRFFGAKVKLTELAESCGVNRNTVSAHNQAIVKVLKGLEHRAFEAFDVAVDERGMILAEGAIA